MKVLIFTFSTLEDFKKASAYDSSFPKLPLAYPFFGFLKEKSFEVEVVSLSDLKKSSNNSLSSYLWIVNNIKYIKSFEVVVAWGSIGAILSYLLLSSKSNSKVVTITYSNWGPEGVTWIGTLKNLFFHSGLRLSGRVAYMTKRQIGEATHGLGLSTNKVSYLPLGVDTHFFTTEQKEIALDENLINCPKEPYVLVAGDQLRDELKVAEIMQGINIKLIRASQSITVKKFWDNWEKKNPGKIDVYCKVKFSYPELRFLYQHALCLLNIVDNSWQPAGWTVATEAMACGTSVIMNKGLVTEEFNFYGDSPIIEINSINNVNGFINEIRKLQSSSGFFKEIAYKNRKFVLKNLDVTITCNAVVEMLKKMHTSL